MHVSAASLELLGIDIIIYDSSSGEETKCIVKNYIIDGFKNVKYVRWSGNFDGFSLDDKVIDAYKDFSDEYEYIWIHRDGLIIDANAVKRSVLPAVKRNNDFLVVNTTCRDFKNLGNRVYASPKKLFSEQLIQMTVLGATIIKGELIMEIIKSIPNEKGKTYGLWQPMSIFHYLANKTICAESIVDNIWIYNTSAAKSSFLGKNTLSQWCDMWCDMIWNLPDCYTPYKAKAMYIYMSDFHPFYAENLLAIRANGGLTFEEVKKCKDKIKYVCNTNTIVFYIISCMPVWLAKLIKKHSNTNVYQLFRAIYYLLFGIVPGEKEILD